MINLFFWLFKYDKTIIFNKYYCLHHNSKFSCFGRIYHGDKPVFCYNDTFETLSLKNKTKINNLYNILYNSKHIFLNYNCFDCDITIYNKKYGWITYEYCHRNDCLNIHVYNLKTVYFINYIYKFNSEFSKFLNKLSDIESEKEIKRNIDFS